MTYICSVGVGIPKYEIGQQEIKGLVEELFPYSEKEVKRLLPIFDHAEIDKRQFVVDREWFKDEHTFQEKNNLYQQFACDYAVAAIDQCLTNSNFLTENIPYEAIDMIMFVSSTGIATPSLDTHILNKRPFREDISRMPLWGLGCCGGAIGLSRAHDWITAHPEKTALLICAELCSLTFQKNDHKKSNLVGTALFGDGISAVLMCGNNSVYRSKRKKVLPKVITTSSFTKKDSLSVMGWDITNNGLEVIFSKSIPSLVDSLWKDHMEIFLRQTNLTEEMVHSFICHPGGKKVLEAMEDVLHIPSDKFANSHKVLQEHGNMSSATVLYVLNEWMKETVDEHDSSILSALGPGFSSELLLLEWTK